MKINSFQTKKKIYCVWDCDDKFKMQCNATGNIPSNIPQKDNAKTNLHLIKYVQQTPRCLYF